MGHPTLSLYTIPILNLEHLCRRYWRYAATYIENAGLMGYPTNYLLNRIQNYQHGGKKPLFCVRICNKNDILCQSCGKKVSCLWMGRIYCQDSRGDKVNWNNPPTEEFEHLTKKYAEISKLVEQHTAYSYYPWMTMLKAVLNDYWMDNPYKDEYESWNLDFVQHFIHKIYYCWYMTMKQLHGEEE